MGTHGVCFSFRLRAEGSRRSPGSPLVHRRRQARGPGRRARTLAVAAPLGLIVLAACGGGGGDDGNGRANPPIEGAPTVEVAGDEFRFEPALLSVDAGRFNVALTSEDIFHTLVIEAADGDRDIAAAQRGETDRGGVELEPGSYVFYCDVPGHRAAGMEGTLTVE